MKKSHKTKPFLFMICIAFSTALFLIHSPASISKMDNSSNYVEKTYTKSTEEMASKDDTAALEAEITVQRNESQDYTIPSLTDISSQTHADRVVALFSEKNSADDTVVSRGTSREPYIKNEDTNNRNDKVEAASTSEDEKSDLRDDLSSFKDESTSSNSPSISSAAKNSTSDAETQAMPINAEKTDSQSDKNLDLLARLITAEAQGEPFDAKVAVGAVVINRVESGDWAPTIADVIYQNINGYYQFTPVENGWINKPADSESIKAAKAALSGNDPTNGAQFYYDDKATNTWILSKPISVQIGHMFYAFNN